MIETGTVIKIENDEAVIEFNKKSDCKNCKNCGFSKCSETVSITVSNEVSAKEGDTVEVQISDSHVLISSILVYILPLIFSVAGLLIGNILLGEIGAFVLFILCLVLSFVSIKILDKVISKKFSYFQPRIKRIFSSENTDKNTQN